MKNIITQINKITHFFIKSKKRLIITSLFLIVLLLVIFSSSKKEKEISKEIFPRKIPDSTTAPIIQSLPYLIAAMDINAESEITNYVWINNKFYYITGSGIHSLDLIKPKLDLAIDYINFNSSKYAVIKSGNSYYLFNPNDISIKQLSIFPEASDKKEALSNDQKYLSVNNVSKFKIYSLENNSIEFEDKIEGFEILKTFWSKNGYLYIFSQNNSSTRIDLFDLNNKSIKNIFQINDVEILLTFSEDENSLLMSKNNSIIISKLKENKNIEYIFSPGSILEANWIDNSKIIVTEHYPIDELGRENSAFWAVDLLGNKYYLTDSKPIPFNIPKNQPLIVDPNKKAVPIIEKRGRIWLLSLIAGSIPFYNEERSQIELYDITKDINLELHAD